MKDQRLQLIGFMGSGKSTYGRLLALTRNTPFRDLDLEIENRFGLSIARLFQREGEAGFRRLERSCYLELAVRNHGVLALGGGLPMQAGIAPEMKQGGPVLYLQTPLPWLEAHLARDTKRPLLAGMSGEERSAWIRSEHARRDPVYKSVADLAVELPEPENLTDCLDRLLAAWDRLADVNQEGN